MIVKGATHSPTAFTIGLFVGRVLLLHFSEHFGPLIVETFPLFWVLFHPKLPLLGRLDVGGLVKGVRVDFLQDGLQGDQRLLQNATRGLRVDELPVPVCVCQADDHGHQHREGHLLIRLQYRQEVVILEEAHGAVGDLEVAAGDALDDALEELGDEAGELIDFADLEDLLQLGEEEGLLEVVGEGPVLEDALEELPGGLEEYGEGQGAVLAEEEHGAPQQLLKEEVAGLDFVEGDDDGLEELHVLFAERDCEAADDGGQDVEELGRPVELVVFVDEGQEAVVDGLADHLPTRHQLRLGCATYLRVQLVQDVLQVLALVVFLRVKELQKLWLG